MATDALDAERSLSIAVLHVALRDYANLTRRAYEGGSASGRIRADVAVREEALAWFLADDPADTWPFTLRNICLRLGRSYRAIQRDIAQWELTNSEDRKRIISEAIYSAQEHRERNHENN